MYQSILKTSMQVATVVAGLAFAQTASASLVYIGLIPSTGNGIGAVNTSLTFQNAGTETGCVAFNGTTAVTGCTVNGITGMNETTGSGNNVFTAAQLAFTATNDFDNLVVIFNGNEGGGPNQPLTLTNLNLTLYSSTGAVLNTFTTAAGTLPRTFDALPGQGNAGFGFALDAQQAAQANALLASNPTLRIGTSARVTGADAGPETIQLTTVLNTGVPGGDPTPIPEPTSMFLLGGGLLGLAGLRYRRS